MTRNWRPIQTTAETNSPQFPYFVLDQMMASIRVYLLSLSQLIGSCRSRTMMKAVATTFALALLLASTAPAGAHQIKVGQLVITHPWIKQSEGQTTAFGCMKITNTGSTDDRLFGVFVSPHTAAQLVEVTNKGNSSAGAIVIPAGQTVHIHPSSAHMALITVPSPFVEGSEVSGSLTFEKAGAVEIDYEVGD
jgi:periplasmic copper chaperone A